MKKQASYLAICRKNEQEFLYIEWEEDGVKEKGVWLFAPLKPFKSEIFAVNLLYSFAESFDRIRDPDYMGAAAVLDCYGDYHHTKVIEQIAF